MHSFLQLCRSETKQHLTRRQQIDSCLNYLTLQAVRKQWLSDEDALRRHHRTLADYFQYHCDDDHILAREAAYHMNCTKDGKRLLEFIKTDERARYIDAVSISRYIKVRVEMDAMCFLLCVLVSTTLLIHQCFEMFGLGGQTVLQKERFNRQNACDIWREIYLIGSTVRVEQYRNYRVNGVTSILKNVNGKFTPS